MVSKKLLLAIAFSLSILLLNRVNGCELYSTQWCDCLEEDFVGQGTSCSESSDCCSGGCKDVKDFGIGTTSCVMGCYAGQYIGVICSSLYNVCGKLSGHTEPEAEWTLTPCSDGQICKKRSGLFCLADIMEGKWDDSEDKCVICNEDTHVENKWFNCDPGTKNGNLKCESACGADPQCDEESPGATLSDSCWGDKLEVNRNCDNNCKYSSTTYTCDSSHCGEEHDCGGQTYYCVLINGEWQWSTTWPNNFCCSDNNCSGYDPDKHTELVCDCPKSECSYPSPPIGEDDYTCKPKRACASNDECAPDYCCVDNPSGVTSPNTGTGECKPKGSVVNNKYFCDPPEWKVENGSTKTESNLFSLIFNFFSNLFS